MSSLALEFLYSKILSSLFGLLVTVDGPTNDDMRPMLPGVIFRQLSKLSFEAIVIPFMTGYSCKSHFIAAARATPYFRVVHPRGIDEHLNL